MATEKEIKAPLQLSDLLLFIDTAYPKFDEKWKDAARNEEIWLGNNFTDKQRKAIKAQGRQPISISQASTKLRRIVGIQESQRTEFNILAAQDPNDEVKAELAKLQVHACEKRSKFPNLETEVFASAIGVVYGVSKMDLDHTDVYPRVMVKKIPYNNFMWDSNSKEFDISEDALWACELEKEYRVQIEKEYPNIKVAQVAAGQQGTFQGREKIPYYVQKASQDERVNDYDILGKFTFYIKSPRKIYYVIFPDSEKLNGLTSVVEGKYDSKEEANERLRELNIPYLLQGLPIEGSVESRDIVGYDKYVFTYNKLLEYEKTKLERFPYDVCFGVKFEEKFVSFMTYLRDPQLFYDRFIMQIDYAMGKDNKSASELNVNALAEEETSTSALNKIEQGKTILKKGYEKAFEWVESKGASPQWLQMVDLLSVILEDLSGGAQFQAKSNAGDSGIKVQQLVAQGSLQAKPFLDNLRRWKVNVGKNILWWLQHYETAEDVIRVQGGALSDEMIALLQKNGIYAPSQMSKGGGFLTINKEGNELSYLADSSFELEVSEEALSDSEKHAKFLIASEQEKADPIFLQSNSWRKYKISLLDIPQEIRHNILQEIDEAQKQQQQAQQMAMQAQQQQNADKLNIEQQRINTEKAKIISGAQPGTFA